MIPTHYYMTIGIKSDRLKKSLSYKGFNFFNTLQFNNNQKYIKDIIEDNLESKYLISNDKIKAFSR